MGRSECRCVSCEEGGLMEARTLTASWLGQQPVLFKRWRFLTPRGSKPKPASSFPSVGRRPAAAAAPLVR